METPSTTQKHHYGLRDRRADFRIACEGAASMDVLSPNPRPNVPVHVVNIGKASLKLSVPFFVSPGALVRIHMTESHANAEVRYCTREGSVYYVGVRVEEVVPNPGAVVSE
jgi:hypothetical protein